MNTPIIDWPTEACRYTGATNSQRPSCTPAFPWHRPAVRRHPTKCQGEQYAQGRANCHFPRILAESPIEKQKMKTTLQGFIAEASTDSIIAMPLGNVRGFYLDLVFSGPAGAVRFSGEAAEMADRTEAFF